jgi:hypothetical protein
MIMNETYQVLDIEENIDGSANILVRAVTERDPVYFLLMNIRDDAVEGVVYDLLIGHEAESGGIEWLKETESSEQYLEILDDVIEDVLRGE